MDRRFNPHAPTKTRQWERGATETLRTSRCASRMPRVPIEKSDATRSDVAINVLAPAQEDDPVTSRI
jgi:hypothetical protein